MLDAHRAVADHVPGKVLEGADKPARPKGRLEDGCCSHSAHRIYLTPQTSMR